MPWNNSWETINTFVSTIYIEKGVKLKKVLLKTC